MSHPAARVVAATTLVGCLYWVLVTPTGWNASFGETNFQNNSIRVDELLNEPQTSHVLVGSSISGRLLSSYFPGGEQRVANLGLDGCTLATGLKIIDRMADKPEVVFLECMMTNFEPQPNDIATLAIVDNPVFKISRWLPVLRPSLRPTSVLYTQIKLTRESAGSEPLHPSGSGSSEPQTVFAAEDTVEGTEPWRTRTIEAVAALSDQGIRCFAVRIPTSSDSLQSSSRPYDLGDELSASLGIPVIDAVSVIRARGFDLTFTDGLHLRSDSARLIAEIIWTEHLTPGR